MEMNEKKPEMHSIVDVDGFIADGKQFDLDITLANDRRNVIFGVVRDNFKEPVKDAVVKLVEVEFKYGKKEIKPVSHTFTDKNGEFVFGPLCPDKEYEFLARPGLWTGAKFGFFCNRHCSHNDGGWMSVSCVSVEP